MATSIPTIPLPSGFSSPVPSAGQTDMTVLPPLPKGYDLSSALGVDTSQGVMTGLAAAANGVSATQQTTNQNNSPVGQISSSIWTQLGTWLKSIALPGTVSVVALLLIILSVYIAATRSGAFASGK